MNSNFLKYVPIALLLLMSNFVRAQSVAYDYQGDFNEPDTSFGLKITHTTSALGHTHHGEYLIVLSSRGGGEMYHFRLNSEYNTVYSYHLDRISGKIISDDNVIVTNTSTQFELQVRFHGSQNDWHRITVHEITPPRGSAPAFLKIDPGQFNAGGTKVQSNDLHVSSAAIPESSTISKSANLTVEGTSDSRNVGDGAALGFVIPANTDGSNPWQQGRILVTPDNTSNANASGRMYLQTRFHNGSWDWKNNLVLRSSGNVGVGTSSPAERLHVNGKVVLGSEPSPRFNNSLSGYVIESTHFYGHTDSQLIYIGETNNSVSVRGKLGIGTTTPTEKLEVNGTIRSKEVKVEAAPWPDYVFEPNYKLRSLEEIEKFIKSEKHLPEVPSSAEVEENGIALGEMNALLLKKIEELTLHLIELKKENDEIITELNLLKNEK